MTDSYDLIPYDAEPFPDARPAYLAGLARLHGLAPAAPAGADVLEIGGATGGHLIPLAWYNPDARFTGIELSQQQVLTGQRLIDALGLDNCVLHCADFTQWPLAPESADYVIAHGLYSWIPPETQVALLGLVRRVLRPGGVAYISYNTMPGWHGKGALRDLLHWHLGAETDPNRRLESAQRLLEAIAPTLGEHHPLTPLIARVREEPASYLAHEYLEQYNFGYYLHEFNDALEAQGLRYVCDATLEIDLPDAFGDRLEQLFEVPEPGLVTAQYLDFLANRGFRQSIVCRDDAASERLAVDRLAVLHLVSHLAPTQRPDLRRAKAQTFASPDGRPHSVVHPLVKQVLVQLHDIFPASAETATLLSEAAQILVKAGAGPFAEQRESALEELLRLVASQAIDVVPEAVHLRPGLTAAEPPGKLPEHPVRASGLAYQQAVQGWGHTTTALHRTLRFDPFIRELVKLLDGSRDRPQLLSALEAGFEPGGPLRQLADPRTGRDVLRRQIGANLDRIMGILHRNGLLAR